MEDFVPLEISKKLKEKKYPQHNAEEAYIIDNFGEDNYSIGERLPIPLILDYIDIIAAPTTHQVLKWLRKEKEIICLPHIDPAEEKWFFYVVKLPQASDFPEYMSSIIYNTYEEAVLAGIEYVIDNLI